MEKSSSNGIPGMKWGLGNAAYFATDDSNFYISCKPNPEELCINQETDTLVVWLNEIDKDKAMSIFAKYLYDQINPELRSSKGFWDLVSKGYRETHIDSLVPKV